MVYNQYVVGTRLLTRDENHTVRFACVRSDFYEILRTKTLIENVANLTNTRTKRYACDIRLIGTNEVLFFFKRQFLVI